jgi:hypothetical protein
MHKTIYIDTDEEIIGIINKIKQAEVSEVFLVVPKNSLLTQGLVNLKLLKKEVAKMGKEIILITSDTQSKKIIELVGLKTRAKSAQDFVRGVEDQTFKQKPKSAESLDSSPSSKLEIDPEKAEIENRKREIGSSSFYGHNKKTSVQPSSERSGELEPQQKELETLKLKVNTENTFGKEHIDYYKSKNQDSLETEKKFDEKPKMEKVDLMNSKSVKENSFNKIINNKELPSIDDFYQNNHDDLGNKRKRVEKKSKSFAIANKKRFFLFGLFLIILVSIFVGSWLAFNNWPKMKVDLHLKEKSIEKTIDLKVCESKEAGDACLKGDYQEIVIELVERYRATGEKFSNDKGMARGIVKIFNNYSSQPQALVATTRLLSKEGKLFRIVKDVVVPGMEGETPGMIEAQVIADKIGTDYNIEPAEFTIEGFKGGDKYDKFKVVSEEKMIGGANDTENKKVKVVREEDINMAREKTLEKFNEELKTNLEKKLSPEESFVFSSIEKSIINSDSSYAPDDIIDEFNYSIKQKIKVITFNQNDFEKRILQSFDNDNIKDLKFNKIAEINYQKDIADYEEKKLDLVAQVKLLYWPVIDKTEIINKLAESDSAEIKTYLSSLENINKAIISYSPSWLSNLPIKNKNISIEEIKE